MLFNSTGFRFVIQNFEIGGECLCVFVLGVSVTLIRICILREGPLIHLLYFYYH